MLEALSIAKMRGPAAKTATMQAGFADKILVASLIAIGIVVGVNIWLGFAAMPYG